MFTCHLWTHVNKLAFQGRVFSVMVPSAKGPTKIEPGYCPIVLKLVEGVVRFDCVDGTEKKTTIAGGTVSVTDQHIIILPKVNFPTS